MKKIFTSILIVGLVLGFTGVLKAADTSLTLTVTAGSLTVTSPASVAFTAVDYSLSGATSTDNILDDIQVSDLRGSEAGWTVVVASADWIDGGSTLDYDGDWDTTGVLTINQDSVSVTKIAGQDIDGVNGPIKGITDNFDSVTTSITILSAAADYGEGEYDADGYNLQQYIPGMSDAGNYSTSLTVTVS